MGVFEAVQDEAARLLGSTQPRNKRALFNAPTETDHGVHRVKGQVAPVHIWSYGRPLREA